MLERALASEGFRSPTLERWDIAKEGHSANDCLVQMREDAFQKAVSAHQKAAITKRFLEHGGLLCGSCSASTGRD